MSGEICFLGLGLRGGSGLRRDRQPERRERWRRGLCVAASRKGSKKKRDGTGLNGSDGEPVLKDLDVVLCHMQADYDTLAAAVGLAKLWGNEAVVVLSGGSNPAVERFLGLFRPMFPIRSGRSIDPRRIRRIGVVDTVRRDRLGSCADWTIGAHSVEVIDHHVGSASDSDRQGRSASEEQCDIYNDRGAITLIRERVGAATTMIVERLMDSQWRLTPGEATLMALGIHTDTGSLTFENTTARDAKALAWLLEQGANQSSVAEFKTPQLNQDQMDVLNHGLQKVEKIPTNGVMLGYCLIETEDFVKGLSVVAQDVMQLSNIDILIFCVVNYVKSRNGKVKEEDGRVRRQISLIGRARPRVDDRVNLNEVFSALGGGGHPKAAAVTIRTDEDPAEILEEVVESIREQIPEEKMTKDFMSTDIVVCRPDDLISEAQELMYSHCLSGLPVVDAENELVGTVLQSDAWTAEKQNRLDEKISHFMRRGSHVVTISPETTLPEVERILALGKAGPLPVLSDGQIVGVVTRIDILRARHLWSPDDGDGDDEPILQVDSVKELHEATTPPDVAGDEPIIQIDPVKELHESNTPPDVVASSN
ncbi:hypothetical protein NDN08_001541 [Rhodosorus marinus]|uniref:CBS domain-containing protein n=1 Tax=Rhodosorus marinus TaxID=101924 RepID=A0AAV8UR36_9RHOD|nr:hypothetical protein NDN08_001541 [Rhodosorus marinus]